jgi:hypothetical protein
MSRQISPKLFSDKITLKPPPLTVIAVGPRAAFGEGALLTITASADDEGEHVEVRETAPLLGPR